MKNQTRVLELDIPSDLHIAINETDQELKSHLKLAFAIMLYQQNKLTIGKAAQLADLNRFEFETILSKYKISISNLNISDIDSDVRKLRDL